MDFRTEVDIPSPRFSLGLRQPMGFVGSCFAEHVGRGLQENKLPCRVNPFGVLYNPASIVAWLHELVVCEVTPEALPVFADNDMWHCWLTDSSFSAPSEDACRERVMQALRAVRGELPRWKCLFLTLGTNRCYRLRAEDVVVGNCHKQPAALFREEELTVEQVVVQLDDALQALWNGPAPDLHVVFTVSPYRYVKYGLHGNQVGKAVLLLAVDRLCRRHPDRCSYFPAYEIVLDELRDYRFYADDMLHPSPMAVQYIRERFVETYLDDEARDFLHGWQRFRRALAHRPLHPGTEAEQRFLQQTLASLDDWIRRYPFLSFAKEHAELMSRINS